MMNEAMVTIESGVAATALPPQSMMSLARARDPVHAVIAGMVMLQSAGCAGSEPDWQQGRIRLRQSATARRVANPVHLAGHSVVFGDIRSNSMIFGCFGQFFKKIVCTDLHPFLPISTPFYRFTPVSTPF